MSRRTWAVAGVVGLVAAGAVYVATGWQQVIPWGLAFFSAVLVGSLIVWKSPRNRIGYLLLVFGGGAWIGGLGPTLATIAEDPNAAGWLDAFGSALNTASVATLPAVLLLFPDGELPGRRWRVLAWVLGLGVLMGASAAVLNGGWAGEQTLATATSPLYESTKPVGDVLREVFFPLFSLAFLGAAGSLVVRYRRSYDESRLQIKWLIAAGVVLIVALVIITGVNGWRIEGADDLWEETLLSVGFAAIPAGIGVAILRHRLYDIDVVISRTIVLSILAGFITIIYAGVVVGLGQAIGGDSDQFLLPIFATAVVAVAFEPVRQRAQRWANRLVFGNRATPYEVLSDLTERLSGAEEAGRILSRMAELLRDGTGAERATVWLGEHGSMVAAATAPMDAVPSETVDLGEESSYTMTHDGEVVGALEVVKPTGTALSSAERGLIADLGGSAGAVLGYQRLNDSLSLRASELEESRTRLLGVQDEERRRLEQDLHEGAEQFIVALKVKLGVASQLAARAGNEKLEALLADLTGEAQAALDDVQSLAKGIYPPVLESEGLEAAVSALAGSTPVEVEFERDGIGRYSADVEAAVYFAVSEAVTNAVKHAEPPIRIEMSEIDGVLRFVVVDSGPGFDLDVDDPGSGLENMADRMEAIGGELTVRSSVGAVTRVSGSIPV